MKPNNEFTAPDQRFFFPINNEAEHHESFDASDVPRTVVLPGDHSYILFEEDGKVIGAESRGWGGGNIPSGSLLTEIVTVDKEAQRYYFLEDEESFEAIADPVAGYNLQLGDMAIFAVSDLTRRSELHKQLDENRQLILPIGLDARLPFANGETHGEYNEVVRYLLEGVIKQDLSLLTWPGAATRHADRLVDLCVALAEAQNRLEVSIVNEAGNGLFNSLLGQLDCSPAVAAYLRHFDKTKDTQYTPTQEPHVKILQYPSASNDEHERGREISNAAHSFISQKRP